MNDLISKYERELAEIEYMMENKSYSTIYVGEGYFADNLSQSEIIQFLNRRKTFVLGQLHSLNPVVEIKEPVNEYPPKVIHYQKEEPKTVKVELQDFEKQMLQRMLELEQQEEMDSQIEILSSEEEEDFSFNHVKIDKRFKDLTLDEDLNSNGSSSTLNQSPVPVKSAIKKSEKKVRFSEQDSIKEIPPLEKPKPIQRNSVMKQLVVERVFDEEEEDLTQLGREISVEYNRMKQKLLDRNLLSNPEDSFSE